MAYGTVVDPVGGTVITVSYAVTNILDPIRWLRLLTGNADPPGSNYVVVSTGPSGTSWQKIPADALASGAAAGNLGFMPLRNSTDTFTGDLTVTGTLHPSGVAVGSNGITVTGAGVTATGGANFGNYGGGSTSAGTASFLGVVIGANGLVAGAGGISSAGPIAGTTGTFSDALSPASYAGGTTSAGTPQFKGLVVGADGASIGTGGVTTTGPSNPAYYAGGSTSNGVPSFLGANIGTSGVAVAGQIASSISDGATPPFTVHANQAGVAVTNLKSGDAAKLGGVLPAGYARIAYGTYSGNNGTGGRQITAGFTTKAYFIQNGAGTAAYFGTDLTNGVFMSQALGIQFQSGFHLHASDGFVVGDGTAAANVSGVDYNWVAFG